jgi:N-acetyl-alpha-D-glucosaminyl L-malate synthase BshA
MKIAIVCYPSYGGSGVIATELGKQMALRGHQVHFISYERPFRLDLFHENIYFHEVEILEYPLFKYPPYSIALAGKIVEVAQCAGLDLIHVHYAMPHAVSGYLARQMYKDHRLPVITTLHGTDITLVGADKQFFDITQFSIEESDGVTTVSDSLKKETLDTFGITRDIRTIYNFIDTDIYCRKENPCLRSKYAGANEKIIMHISNFRPLKRIYDICKVFQRINQEVPSHLLLVGDGPDINLAMHFAQEHNLQSRIHFLGKQERVVELLSIADLFLLLSEKESFGLVALEAMACGVPVVATNIGGIPEVIEHGVTGFLSALGDIEGLASHAIHLLQDEDIYNTIRINGREKAVNHFDSKVIIPEYEDYYHEVINS